MPVMLQISFLRLILALTSITPSTFFKMLGRIAVAYLGLVAAAFAGLVTGSRDLITSPML